MMKALLTLAFVVMATTMSAYTLKVQGVVTDYYTHEPLSGVLVRIYKNGEKISAENTGAFGKYAAKLENNAHYVIRFSGPGLVTKSFTVDTHGLVWEGEQAQKSVIVEMTMMEKLNGVDLTVFDLPMGQAHFEPATGYISWNTAYDKNIRPEVEAALSRYAQRLNEIAVLDRPQGVARIN